MYRGRYVIASGMKTGPCVTAVEMPEHLEYSDGRWARMSLKIIFENYICEGWRQQSRIT